MPSAIAVGADRDPRAADQQRGDGAALDDRDPHRVREARLHVHRCHLREARHRGLQRGRRRRQRAHAAWRLRSGRVSIAPAWAPCDAADAHVLDRDERGVAQPQPARRRAAAATTSAQSSAIRSRRRPASAARETRRTGAPARDASAGGSAQRAALRARPARGAAPASGRCADAAQRAIHPDPSSTPPAHSPAPTLSTRLAPGKAHVAERLHLGLELDSRRLEHAPAPLGHHGDHVGGRRRRPCSR